MPGRDQRMPVALTKPRARLEEQALQDLQADQEHHWREIQSAHRRLTPLPSTVTSYPPKFQVGETGPF